MKPDSPAVQRVVRLRKLGMTNEEISNRTGLAPRTVNNYILIGIGRRRPQYPRWTREKTEELIALHAKRLSTPTIAKHFSTTRDAILGKLHRLKKEGRIPCSKQPSSRSRSSRRTLPPRAFRPRSTD